MNPLFIEKYVTFWHKYKCFFFGTTRETHRERQKKTGTDGKEIENPIQN